MQRLYHKMRPNRYGDCYTNQGIDPSTLRYTQGVAWRQLSVRLNFDRLSCRAYAEVLSKFRVKRFEFFFYVLTRVRSAIQIRKMGNKGAGVRRCRGYQRELSQSPILTEDHKPLLTSLFPVAEEDGEGSLS
ncbi:MAG: hypothetical protein RIC07_37165 [Coleofasciculus sp. E1-EBD-02]